MLDTIADQVRSKLRRLLGYVTGEYTPLPQRPDDFLPPAPRPAQPPPDADAVAPATDQITDDDFNTLLREGRIRTEYQPIVSLVDGGVIGYEALSRGPIVLGERTSGLVPRSRVTAAKERLQPALRAAIDHLESRPE